MHVCPEQMHIIEFNRFRFRARSSSHRFWFGTNISGGNNVSPSTSAIEKLYFFNYFFPCIHFILTQNYHWPFVEYVVKMTFVRSLKWFQMVYEVIFCQHLHMYAALHVWLKFQHARDERIYMLVSILIHLQNHATNSMPLHGYNRVKSITFSLSTEITNLCTWI